MKKREGIVLTAVGVALVVMVIHQLVCACSGTILSLGNVVFSMSLLAFILAGCLSVLKEHRYMNWKHVVFLCLSVAILVLLELFLYIPTVLNYLGLARYVALITLHIVLQILVGIGFFSMVKPKKSTAESE